jgi:hypothetical protein
MAHALQLSMAALHEHVLHLLQRNDFAALDFCSLDWEDACLTDVEAARGSPSVTA